MALWAISDLHLSLSKDKPMDIFGDNWLNHEIKIKENWIKNIKNDDTVIIAGDISWSMDIEDGFQDLEWIKNLPGNKLLVRGNHDYWWESIKKLNSLYSNMKFIQNNSFNYKDYGICGTRLWTLPGGNNYSEHDYKIYNRENIRLRLSLEDAIKKGYSKLIVAVHYPPIYNEQKDNEITSILQEYGVEKVIYGHLHGYALKSSFNGFKNGIEYINTSCDYLDFSPKLIIK